MTAMKGTMGRTSFTILMSATPVTMKQAVPIGGSYSGEGAYLGMEVDVTVKAESSR